jgi:cell division protein FtsN
MQPASERELQSLSFFVPARSHKRRKFFIIEPTPLIVTVVVNFPDRGEQFQMATKSSKQRKTTSSKHTGEPGSTVTPIGPAGNLRETQGRVATPAEPRALDQKNLDHRNQADARIEEEIRIRAYELFEQRGRQEGFHDQDWARAEAEVLARYRRDKSA